MDTIPFENLEEKLMKYREEDRNNSILLENLDYFSYSNERRELYENLIIEISRNQSKIFHEILEPLKIKPIVKRDLKTIIGGISLGIIGGPFSLLAISGYFGFKKLFRIKSEHGDQYTLMGISFPLIALGVAISEIKNPLPIAYKITNKANLKSNNISKTRVEITLLTPSKDDLNPDYIQIDKYGSYPIELHFSDDTSYSLRDDFKQKKSQEIKTGPRYYFEANFELIEKLQIFSKHYNLLQENNNLLTKLRIEKYPRLMNNPNPNWVKATAL